MTEERQLATIQKIEILEDIPGADFIAKAKLHNLEWQFVVKKNEFKVDDLCVYFEIDSLLPEIPIFEFMRERKFRVKTIKLKKIISQGLCMPISDFPGLGSVHVGKDVSEIIGVTKYLTPTERNERLLLENKKKTFWQKYFSFGKNKKKDKWPKFVKKTDEPRIQTMNYQQIYEQFKEKVFYVTEKIDYQSATFFTKNQRRFFFFKSKYFGVCSRNIWLKKEDNSLYWKVARLYDLERILTEQKNEMIIQGEQGGPGIQDNKYGLSSPKMWIFNIIEIRNRLPYQYNYDEMKEFCDKYMLSCVPFISYYYLPENIDMLIDKSKGFSQVNNKVLKEGIVIRCIENGEKKLSFKVINPDYLLKYEE